MGKICYEDGSKRKNINHKKYYKKEEPFICKKCSRVWQFTENNIYVDYIPTFPKYGCTQKTCRQCEDQ